ncbi:MAG: hypothetical protein M3O71_04780 [Bacteroidota bacterium]|nr:hypothetical protein [Bacteroidota bacterium]
MIEILEKVLSECKEYVDELKKCPKGYFLYRGTNYEIGDAKLLESRLAHRPPLNMPPNLHDSINKIAERKFGWKIRNGVFCYGFTSLDDVPDQLGYGKQYLCFPVGYFTFIYSPQHFDLVGHFNQMDYQVSDSYIEQLLFKTDSLKDAIDSNKYRNGISNEIIINVPKFYLADVIHRNSLAEAIWS